MKRKLLTIGLPVLLGVAAVGLWGLSTVIDVAVDAIGEEALAHAPAGADMVEALMTYVADAGHPLDRRNRAVWALGRLADPRALPLLEELHTGAECRHGEELCQHELAKAVRRCREAAAG